uniref:RNA-dependent RNA polymerase n=1 Tax=Leersia perrieri TaxID=77586 RepID=A0A0D9W5Y6_9ORYZ
MPAAAVALASPATASLRVSNIPPSAVAAELLSFFDSAVAGYGVGGAFASEIMGARRGWLSRGHGTVQFESAAAAGVAVELASSGRLPRFLGAVLSVSPSPVDLLQRASDASLRAASARLVLGDRVAERVVEAADAWDGVRAEVIPAKRRVDLYLEHDSQRYRLEVFFEDMKDCLGCTLDGVGAILLQLNYAPRIHTAISGPAVNSRFMDDRFHACKEDAKFSWVRALDFTPNYSFGKCSTLVLKLGGGALVSDILKSLPFSGDLGELTIFHKKKGELTMNSVDGVGASSNVVPLVHCPSDCSVPYEVLFRLNSLIHMGKIVTKHVNADLFKVLKEIPVDVSRRIFEKMNKLESTCYEPLQFIQQEFYSMKRSHNALFSSEGEGEKKLMKCYRVHITPSKIFCFGPEDEVTNYVVKHHSAYASDFVRVTFVDEDWSKLSANAISARIEQEGIRRWMGHFQNIRSISKCAARMGQLFSSSRQTFEVATWHVEVIPDIEITTDGSKYIFSDGIGKISLRFARQVAHQIGLDPANPPSAFQIRYGGYKGVIAVDPMSSIDLSLRPSMMKFESESRMLNITSWSKSQPCYVNREIISLLSTLGISDDIFVAMQQDDMRETDEMLTNKEVALSVLGKLGGSETKTALKMLLQGILDYGQVYIRITKNSKEQKYSDQSYFYNVDEETATIVGKVAITKNPCLHPGDIRVLEAIYDPELEDMGLVDCLVFPQRGERPHPNECSGGDLDGDLYFITWDDRLIPEKVETPMDYTATRPRIMDHVVTLEEIQKHFVDYMINDALGVISTAHLIHADRAPLKARSPECLQLATLHSMAVDFAKTGAPAEMPRSLRPREYPNFMERWEKPMYISEGVLGKLYRSATGHMEEKSETPSSPGQPNLEYDPDLEIPGSDEFLEAAEEHYELYEEKLTTLMNYYRAEREDEILTGNIRNRMMYLKRDNKRYFEMKDRIVAAVDGLHREVRGWLASSTSKEDAPRMASAWYRVTYHPDRHAGKRFWSFPWVACDNLMAIKESSRLKRRVLQQRAAEDGSVAVQMDCSA